MKKPETVEDDVTFDPIVSDIFEGYKPGVKNVEDADDPDWGISPADTKPKKDVTDVIRTVDEDLSNYDLADAEARHHEAVLADEAKPLINDAVNTEVKKAVRLNNERLKLEVNEILADEVGQRLDKFERKRKARAFRETVGRVFKWGLVILIVCLLLGNTQLRNRISTVVRDFGEIVTGLLNDEEVSSNKLVDDMIGDVDETDEEATEDERVE